MRRVSHACPNAVTTADSHPDRRGGNGDGVPRFGLDEQSQVLQFASISFDAAVSEIFTTLCAGGTLHLAPRETL